MICFSTAGLCLLYCLCSGNSPIAMDMFKYYWENCEWQYILFAITRKICWHNESHADHNATDHQRVCLRMFQNWYLIYLDNYCLDKAIHIFIEPEIHNMHFWLDLCHAMTLMCIICVDKHILCVNYITFNYYIIDLHSPWFSHLRHGGGGGGGVKGAM